MRLLFIACVLTGLLSAAAARGGEAPGQSSAQPPAIDVQRDEDKTVYSIGAGPKDEGKDDADKAWNMLDNATIDARGAHGKRPDNNR
jgi:hypothetical protein